MGRRWQAGIVLLASATWSALPHHKARAVRSTLAVCFASRRDAKATCSFLGHGKTAGMASTCDPKRCTANATPVTSKPEARGHRPRRSMADPKRQAQQSMPAKASQRLRRKHRLAVTEAQVGSDHATIMFSAAGSPCDQRSQGAADPSLPLTPIHQA